MTADGGNQVAVQILNPSGLAYGFEPAGLLDDGSFTFPLSVGGPLGISGTYNIHVEYAGHHASTSFYFEAPRSHLAVNAVSQDRARLHMWFSVETFRIGSGSGGISSFTPTGVTLDSGRTYPVTVSDYLDSKFSHWEDGSTNRTRTVMLSENTTITAYYKSGQSIRGFTPLAYAGSDQEPDLNENAATFDGRALHMWTRIQNVETTEEGTTTYTVTPRDFNGRYFDHWEDGSTSRTRTLTISEDTTITAYYRTA
jgi:hypothetical protein